MSVRRKIQKALLLAFCLNLLLASESFSKETKLPQGYSRNDANWYIGFGFGYGTEIFDFFMAKDTEFHISPGDTFKGYSVTARIGVILISHLLVGFEYYLVSDAKSVFHYYGGCLTFFPDDDLGLYFKGSYNYGEFDYRGRGEPYGKGEGHGFRVGAGYGLRLMEAFTPELELSYSATFDEKGVYSSISFLMIFSWY